MTDNGQVEIEVDDLCKYFGDVHAVESINFKVSRGEIFGFLGPNGAGKSTTIRILCTLLRPTSGSARVAGYEVMEHPAEVRRNIGLVAEKLILYDRLTALENLDFFGKMNHLPRDLIKSRSEEWLKRLEMYEWKDKLAGTFSTGMKQRVNIARALLTQPSIMFLDEPTLGLDPQTTRSIRQFIQELADANITVVLTTHIMAEAEALCDRISIIDQGKIVALDTATNLKKMLADEGVVLDMEVGGLNDGIKSALEALDFVHAVAEPEAAMLKVTATGTGAVRQIIDTVEERGGSVKRANTLEPNLEDVFLHLTGTEMRAELSGSAGSAAGGPGAPVKKSRIR
ncbi:MAG TPA: ATP-binding cassette domain-containing protein [Candidatus Anoxymicrobiaceae bacterium]